MNVPLRGAVLPFVMMATMVSACVGNTLRVPDGRYDGRDGIELIIVDDDRMCFLVRLSNHERDGVVPMIRGYRMAEDGRVRLFFHTSADAFYWPYQLYWSGSELALIAPRTGERKTFVRSTQ